MESTLQRLLAVSIALLLLAGIIALNDHGKSKAGAAPTPSPTSSLGTIATAGCMELPGRGSTPSWYPSSLPLPEGSYPSNLKLPESRGYPRAIFAVRGTLRDFIRFVLKEWPNSGWTLGQGEAEAGEAEDNFFRLGTQTRGAFVARTSFCDQAWTWVYVVLGTSQAPRPIGSPTGRATPLNPSR